MLSKHTPGPWRTDNGIAVVTDELTHVIVVAHANGGPIPHRGAIGARERLANTRLIAAAPELLEALVNLADSVDNDMTRKYPASFPGFLGAIARARGAIRKAKGEPEPAGGTS